MSTAKIYFTRLDPESDVDEIVSALQHAAGRLCAELSDVGLRRMPRLVFALDREFESGERALWLLDRLRGERHPPPESPVGDAKGARDAPEQESSEG